MIHVQLNNQAQPLESSWSLQQALDHWQAQELFGARYAVAINGEFIPRAHYDNTVLHDSDCVDVVEAVGGG